MREREESPFVRYEESAMADKMNSAIIQIHHSRVGTECLWRQSSLLYERMQPLSSLA